VKKAFRYEAPLLPLNFICFLSMLASFGFRVYRAVLPHADVTGKSVIFFFCFPLMASLIFGTLIFFRVRTSMYFLSESSDCTWNCWKRNYGRASVTDFSGITGAGGCQYQSGNCGSLCSASGHST